MENTRKTRIAGATFGMTTLAAAVMMSAPAEAVVVDIDRPKLSALDHDFGKVFANGAPRQGGDLVWDVTNGLITPALTGVHFVGAADCGRVLVEYFDDQHDLIGSRRSPVNCDTAPGVTPHFTTISNFTSAFVDHVHVSVQRQSGPGFVTLATVAEDRD